MTSPCVNDLQTRLVRVYGRLQGVVYRQVCIEDATTLGVTGWVRNRRAVQSRRCCWKMLNN
ncbi:acylphosphatase [Burkholderia pseudomallei]|uniref:acylphosphatase n=1 Tax=Burkholderia pseudomallei TaxID=28450 RepID=UPI00387AF425